MKQKQKPLPENTQYKDGFDSVGSDEEEGSNKHQSIQLKRKKYEIEQNNFKDCEQDLNQKEAQIEINKLKGKIKSLEQLIEDMTGAYFKDMNSMKESVTFI